MRRVGRPVARVVTARLPRKGIHGGEKEREREKQVSRRTKSKQRKTKENDVHDQFSTKIENLKA